IDGLNNVLHFQPCVLTGTSRHNIRNDHSRIGAEFESGREFGRDRLHADSSFTAMQVTILTKLWISVGNDCTRNGETQSLVAAALRENERVDSHQFAVDIHEWTTTIAGIRSRIALYVDHRTIRIHLASRRADYTHRDGVLQTFRTTKSKYKIALAQFVVIAEMKCRKFCRLNLQHGQIDVFIRTDYARVDQARPADDWFTTRFSRGDGRHADAHVLRSADHMRVRYNVTVRIDNHSGSDLLLHTNQQTTVSAARLD